MRLPGRQTSAVTSAADSEILGCPSALITDLCLHALRSWFAADARLSSAPLARFGCDPYPRLLVHTFWPAADRATASACLVARRGRDILSTPAAAESLVHDLGPPRPRALAVSLARCRRPVLIPVRLQSQSRLWSATAAAPPSRLARRGHNPQFFSLVLPNTALIPSWTVSRPLQLHLSPISYKETEEGRW